MKSNRTFLNCLAWIALMSATFGNPVFAQTLSIKKVDAQYAIEANSPAGSPHSLQTSPDMRFWVDVAEDVPETYSYSFNPTGVVQRFFRITPKVEAPPIRVMIIGDSMSADCCGWGLGMYQYFKPSATVINYAVPWASTKVFLQSAEMEKMLLVKPNYVLMQFAWTDGSAGDVDRMTTYEEFEANLRTLVETVRGFDGVPIMVTLQAARVWDSTGKVVHSDHPRNAITRRVAAEMNVQLIDVYKITFDLFSQLGPNGAGFFHWTSGGPDDVMHISALGAQWVSRLMLQQFPEAVAPHLKGIFEPLTAPTP